ncbi:MAG TPA: hypothetical protein VGP93_00825, partial [Polyangiaceae bacterium]|nr:hypothetical protein [Polyangiaceae bacterium]
MTDTTRAAGSEQSASEAAEARAESAVKVESPPARARKVDWLQALALSLAIASLLGPLAAAGIWDPHELRVA